MRLQAVAAKEGRSSQAGAIVEDPASISFHALLPSLQGCSAGVEDDLSCFREASERGHQTRDSAKRRKFEVPCTWPVIKNRSL